ncbi:MAG: hypothetical protein WCS52_02890 [bacterium]
MKKRFPVIVSVLCAAASVSMAQKAVPYQDTYEGYAVGSNLVGSVWNGDTNTSLAIVTNVSSTAPSVGYPVPAAAHTRVMAFSEGTITNEFNGTTSNLTVVAFDTMVKPVFAEPPAGSQMASVSNSQLSLYIDTNGFVNVYHGVTTDTLPGKPQSTQWSVLTNGTQLSSGTWCRLTVVMNYDAAGPIAMYKVSVNGSFINSAQGYASPDVGSAKGNGPWLISPLWDDLDLRMHRVVLSGSGMLDDMVVTTNDIVFNSGVTSATNGVPISWMQANGVSTNSTNTTWDAVALDDQDGDGVSTWAEWIMGTSPTNSASKLVIVSSTYSNGFPILKWIGSASAQNNYTIQWSSNLLSVLNWTNAVVNWPKADGTNEVTLPKPQVTPAFMRVTVPAP